MSSVKTIGASRYATVLDIAHPESCPWALLVFVFVAHPNNVMADQWPFQEPKLEVPTIYKAYVM